jgi:enoyl-CoA hydratase/carnithine racemase
MSVELVRDELGVATVTFSSPPFNLLDGGMFEELRSVVAGLGRDVPRAVFFRGGGRVVSAGVDVRVFEELADPAAAEAFIARLVALVQAVERLPCPTVFAAHGLCLTWAFELALSCDLIVAAERASFGLTERVIGLTPCMGGVQRIAERAGTARASQVVLTGQRFSAGTLDRWNVINLVLPDSGFAERAYAVVADLARGPTRAHVATKLLLQGFREGGVARADRSTPEVAGALFASSDLRRGIRSFLADGPGHVTFYGS